MSGTGKPRHAVAATLSFLCFVQVAGKAQCEITIHDIKQAWRKNEKKVSKFKFYWQERWTMTKGSALDSRDSMRVNPDKLDFPPKDVTFNTLNVLSVDGAKMRHRHEGMAVSIEKGNMVPQVMDAVFDGETSRNFRPRGMVNEANGFIYHSERHQDANSMRTMALLLAFRPLDRHYGDIRLAEFEVSGLKAKVDGSTCIVLTEFAIGNRLVRTLWLDPLRDFAVVRYMIANATQVLAEGRIKYVKTEKHAWVPDRWESVVMKPDGAVRESYNAVVTKYFINEPLPEDEFLMTFPAGTKVHDQISGKTYIVEERPTTETAPKAHSEGPQAEQTIADLDVWDAKQVAGLVVAVGVCLLLGSIAVISVRRRWNRLGKQ